MSFQPLDVPPGLNSDDTTYSSDPAWADGSNVRFRLGRPQVIGGWESLTLSLLSGVCRKAFAWTDNANVLNVALGQHNKLHVYVGGALADITPAAGFTAGAINGAGSAGYGTGGYGVGGYGQPSATDYFALTWSLAAWGQKLLASPRNQTIFEWANATGTPAAAVANAPAQVTYMLVAPTRQVFALGCSQEVGGAFNPMAVRHSGIGDETSWSTTSSSASTSREYVLPGGGRIVSGRMLGRNLLIWTNEGLFLGTYYGQVGKVWGFDKVADKCGLIAPNAVATLGGAAFWMSPDRTFHSYMVGGAVQTLPCPIRKDIADNIAASQADKITASTVAEFGEVRWDYPDARDGQENSRYVVACVEGPDAGNWYRGQMSRSAMTDAGVNSFPIGVSPAGNVYWHEKGNSADGAALAWFIRTADVALDDNFTMLARKVRPDIAADQVGAVTLTITTMMYPQGAERTFGPYVIPPGADEVDILAEGRLFRLLYSGNSAPSYARLGKMAFDVKTRGRR